MALKGTLKDFGLSDIFQLIALQKKTGVLHLEDRGKKVVVTFSDGKVVGAEALSDKTREKERVGDILLKSGILTRAQLDSALAEQKQTMKKLGAVLVERRLIAAAVFSEVFSFQIRETLLKIFQWTSGSYHFDTSKVAFDKEFISPLTAEFILMEAARVIDEWPGVRRKIPSNDVVFARIPGAETKVVRPQPGEEKDLDIFGEGKARSYGGDKFTLVPAQEKVFALVDGNRTVEELAYQTLLGEFEVCRVLLDLAGMGLIKPFKVPAAPPRAEEPARERKGRRGALLMAATLAGAAAFLAGLFYLSSVPGAGLLNIARLTGDKASLFRRMAGQAQVERVRFAVEVHRLEQGGYPRTVEDLVSGGYLIPSDLTYPFGRPYTLAPAPGGPSVLIPVEP